MKQQTVILMPVFEDRQSACALLRAIAATAAVDTPFCVVVEDGSVRDPVQAEDVQAAGVSGEVIVLARNMGHQRAIATGLVHVARCHPSASVVIMDADGEDPASAIPVLLHALKRDGVDAVVAERRRRSETWSFRAFYFVYRLLFQIVTGRTIRFGNFSAMSAATVQRLVLMPELWLHFASSLIVSRVRIKSIPIDRGCRFYGASRMNFVSLALHGMRSMMVFAEDVVVRVVLACTCLAIAAASLLAISAGLKLAGIATPGWYSTASGILVVILLQAGILAFLMLMVSGAARSGPPVLPIALDLLIAQVISVPVRGIDTTTSSPNAETGQSDRL